MKRHIQLTQWMRSTQKYKKFLWIPVEGTYITGDEKMHVIES